MQPVPRFTLDLTQPPEQRWRGLSEFRESARSLLRAYADLPHTASVEAGLDELERHHVSPEHVAEIDGIAALLGVDRALVRRANYHYDGMKLANGPPPFACTAIAVASPAGPIHARNLDWFTSGGMLAKATTLVDFVGAPAGPFTLVTWPGFAGALSGLAPGRFAITLNFVVSGEPFSYGAPAVFALRRVLETCSNFSEARSFLVSQPLISDALLLLSGTNSEERVVIERTPTRAAVRTSHDKQPLVVTNDYRALELNRGSGELSRTSCARFDRATDLASEVETFDSALAALRDAGVRMQITAQHMVMQAASGRLEVALPTTSTRPPSEAAVSRPPRRQGWWTRIRNTLRSALRR